MSSSAPGHASDGKSDYTDSAYLSILVKSPADAPGTPALPLKFARASSPTVLDVKASLEREHPNHPVPASQRLIHAGKLLVDASKLADVLTGAAPQVVHLVTPPVNRQQQIPPPPATATMAATATPAPAAVVQTPYEAHMAEVEAAFQNVLRHQTRYLAMLRGNPPATPEETAAELDAVRTAVAAYDESAQRHRAAIVNPVPPANMHLNNNNINMANILGNVPNVAPFPANFAAQVAARAQANLNQGNNNNNDINGVQGQVWRRHLVFQFDLHWGLLVKLALFVFILAQEGSPRRTKMLGALAVFIYFWQTGHLGFVRRLIGVLLPSPTVLFSYLAPSPAPVATANNNNNNNNNSSFGRKVAVALSYLYSFCYGFICSLLPSWNPEPIPNQVRQPDNEQHQHAD